MVAYTPRKPDPLEQVREEEQLDSSGCVTCTNLVHPEDDDSFEQRPKHSDKIMGFVF